MIGIKNVEIRKLLGLEPVCLAIKKSRPRWFGHVEHTPDEELRENCECYRMMFDVDGTRWLECPRTTWWHCVLVESLGLSKRGCTAQEQEKSFPGPQVPAVMMKPQA